MLPMRMRSRDSDSDSTVRDRDRDGVGVSSTCFPCLLPCCFVYFFLPLTAAKENNFFFQPVVRREPNRERLGACDLQAVDMDLRSSPAFLLFVLNINAAPFSSLFFSSTLFSLLLLIFNCLLPHGPNWLLSKYTVHKAKVLLLFIEWAHMKSYVGNWRRSWISKVTKFWSPHVDTEVRQVYS